MAMALPPDDGLTKFQRHRQAQARRGMKLLRVWVPDPKAPEFQAEVARQTSLLHGAPEEDEALRYIADTADWPEP